MPCAGPCGGAILRAATAEMRRGSAAMMEKKDDKKKEEIRVVDRRTFTSDGQRRTPDQQPDDSTPALQGAPSPDRPSVVQGPKGSAALPSREDQAASAHFINLVRNLAATAAANLGEMPSPFTGQVEVDLEGARQVIDLLQALQTKTRGNLTGDESRLLESLLYDLKVAIVNLQKPKPSKTT
jgi:hypothetical protein